MAAASTAMRLNAVKRLAPAILIVLLVAGCGGAGKSAATAPTLLRTGKYAAVALDAEQAAKIWEKAPTRGQLDEALAASRRASDEGFVVLSKTGTRQIADQFLEQYRSSDLDLITLVGHNNEGSFRFADGSYVQLGEIGQMGGPALAVISCDSAVTVNGVALGVPGALTFSVAYDVSGRFASKIGSLQALPAHEELQTLLTASLNEVARERQVQFRYRVGVAGVGTSGIGLVIWEVYTD